MGFGLLALSSPFDTDWVLVGVTAGERPADIEDSVWTLSLGGGGGIAFGGGERGSGGCADAGGAVDPAPLPCLGLENGGGAGKRDDILGERSRYLSLSRSRSLSLSL